MEQPADGDDVVPALPLRGEYLPPPWFGREEAPSEVLPADAQGGLRFSWPRMLGLLSLVLLIICVPIDFALNYAATGAESRTSMAMGFVWAVVIEILAIWGLFRLLARR